MDEIEERDYTNISHFRMAHHELIENDFHSTKRDRKDLVDSNVSSEDLGYCFQWADEIDCNISYVMNQNSSYTVRFSEK